jgi:hypothetical protein
MTHSYLHDLRAQMLLTNFCNKPAATLIQRMELVIASPGSEETTRDEFFDLYKEGEDALFAETVEPLMELDGFNPHQARLQTKCSHLRSMVSMSEAYCLDEGIRIASAAKDLRATIASISMNNLSSEEVQRLENMADRSYKDALHGLVAALAQQIAAEEAAKLASKVATDSHKTARDTAALRIQDARWITVDHTDNSFTPKNLAPWALSMNAATNNLTTMLAQHASDIDGDDLVGYACIWVSTANGHNLFELEDPTVRDLVQDIADGMFDPNKAAVGLLPVGSRALAPLLDSAIWITNTTGDPEAADNMVAIRQMNSTVSQALSSTDPDYGNDYIVAWADEWVKLNQSCTTMTINDEHIAEQMWAVSLGALDSNFDPTNIHHEEGV